MIYAALILLALAFFLLWQSARQQNQTGLPTGRVIYVDAARWGNKAD